MEKFGTDEGNVVEVKNFDEFKKHISKHCDLAEYELFEFPVPTHKLLQD